MCLRPSFAAVAALSCAVVFAAVPAVAADADAHRACEVARGHREAGRLDAAIIELRNCLQADPENLPGRLELGQAYLAQGNGAGAETELKRARASGADAELVLVPLAEAYIKQGKFRALVDEVKPDPRMGDERRAELLVLRGKALLEANRLADAEAEFTQAAELGPTTAAPLLGQAAVLIRQNLLEPARETARRAMDLAGSDPEPWYVLGQVQQLERTLPEALESYSRALEYAPGHVPARLARAALLADLGRGKEALADLERVAADEPQSLEMALLKSMTLLRLGDEAGARKAILDADAAVAKLAPEALRDNGPALLLSGAIELARDNVELAVTRLARYLELYPRHLGAGKMLASAHLQRGDASSAIAVLRPALALAPRDAGLHAMLGRAYLAIGDQVAATGMFEKAAALEPDTAALQTDLGLAQALAGRKDEAVGVLQRALELDPGQSRAGPILGYLHLEQGRPAEALALADRLLQMEPGNPLYQNLAGMAHLRLGDAAAARERFERALASEPKYSPAEFNLAELDRRDGKPDAAGQRYARILERDPDNAQALTGLADLALERGDIDTALARLEKAVAKHADERAPIERLIDVCLAADRGDRARDLARMLEMRAPQEADVVVRRALVNLSVGYRDEALMHLRRASRMAGTDAGALARVAQGFLAAGDAPAARALLDQASTASSGDAPAVEAALVRIDIGTGDIEAALQRAGRLRSRHPDWPLGYVLAGDALLASGDARGAVTLYRQGRERGDSAELAASLYAARVAAGEDEAAWAELEAWVTANPGGGPAARVHAAALYRAGRLADARVRYEALAAADPRDPTVMNNLAWVLHDAGEPAAALARAEAAERLAPGTVAALDTLGWMLLANGRAQDAEARFRKALALQPADRVVRYHLAAALAELGRREEARTELAAALGDGSPFPERTAAESLSKRLAEGG